MINPYFAFTVESEAKTSCILRSKDSRVKGFDKKFAPESRSSR